MPINFVLVGKYQVGKSALINAMFFNQERGYRKVAKEGDLEPTTAKIKYYKCDVDGVVFHIYDTMGLQDGKKRDREHARWIKEVFASAHLVLYCTKLQEPVRPDDVDTLKILTKECGKSFWKNAVIAFTFANTAATTDATKEDWFGDLLEKKKDKLRRCFIDDLGISQEVWDELSWRTVPVGNTINPALPGIEDWRAKFWLECVHACAEEAKVSVAALAWKEEAFFQVLASGGVAYVGTAAAAAGSVLEILGVATSVTVVGLPVGIPIAVVGLAALVGGAAATAVAKHRASSESSENKDEK